MPCLFTRRCSGPRIGRSAHLGAGGAAPDKATLADELRTIARRGYARNRDALRLGVSSVAIPVFDAASRAVATCSVAYPTSRGGNEVEARLARLLMDHGRDISEAMGGTVPPDVQNAWTPSQEKAAS
ncbi:IclR family transcriptional regulator C-terminal domain-containing protein [Tateyamaria armeniaca]|uniref:IclR family transcriptional regulator C-terminal domain-containing protein n=1 Tax=Tateyamaria armeniaca TaxID=2518930 RepID=A0ABW8UUC9_9RHOB